MLKKVFFDKKIDKKTDKKINKNVHKRIIQQLSIGLLLCGLVACSRQAEPLQQPTPLRKAESSIPQTARMSPAANRVCANAGGTAGVARHLDGSVTGACLLGNGQRCEERFLLNGACPG